ncbi:MAG: type II secretion system F family protein [Sphingorhabdus sp.]|nr:type II secretion system F family protein [Sphingorhabdus sp.]
MLANFALSTSMRIALLVLIFLFVVVIVMLASNYLLNRSAVRGRLDELGSGNRGTSQGASLRRDRIAVGWAKLTDRIEKAGISLVDSQGDKLRAQLMAAGYTSPTAPKLFTLIRMVTLFLLPGLLLLYIFVSGIEVSALKLYVFGVLLAVFGLYVPNLFISAKADRRREAMINGFPDCLDLTLVCVEAGLGMESAFDRVGREMVHSHPLIAELLSMVTLELRAGASREQALRKMADRSQVDEIKSFATLLIQSDKLGSSIGETLRVYANEMREKRRLRAEEKAHRLPVLLSIPLVACMLPVMIGVLMLPAFIRVIRQVAPALAGG